LREGIKFRVCVESFGCKMGESEQIKNINRLSFIPFKGIVQLKQPEARILSREGTGLDNLTKLQDKKKDLINPS
jgi:hypothetical protein